MPENKYCVLLLMRDPYLRVLIYDIVALIQKNFPLPMLALNCCLHLKTPLWLVYTHFVHLWALLQQRGFCNFCQCDFQLCCTASHNVILMLGYQCCSLCSVLPLGIHSTLFRFSVKYYVFTKKCHRCLASNLSICEQYMLLKHPLISVS